MLGQHGSVATTGITRSTGTRWTESRMQANWRAFWARWDTGEWETETRDLIRRTLKPGDLFLDVGAWIGPTAAWAHQAGANVIAVEPDPVARRELAATLDHIGAVPVEVWGCALAPHDEGVRMVPKDDALGNSMTAVNADGELEVPSRTLAQILGPRKPRLVKVDVEGYEVVLCPAIMPGLAELGSIVQVSLHGAYPDRACFDAFGHVEWPDHVEGDIRAFPGA